MLNKFRQKVYKIVANIPRGEVLSYQEVARRAGNIKASRAVGNILNKHKIKNLPCHRVICKNGFVGGYQWGIKKKIELLKKEGIKISKKGKIIDQ
jgi:O-6-methylguanine DNA methyltransferase